MNLLTIIDTGVVIFFIGQFINVILSTMKTILTVSAGRHTAMLINTITYTFYSGVLKLLSDQPMVVVLVTTFITNVVGVELAIYWLNKAKKDLLWKIEVTIPTSDAEEVHCELADIPHNYIYISPKYTLFNFYCATQNESAIVKKMIKKHNAKYFVAESKNL